MQQLDRRRALLSAEGGSGWDISFYASSGVLPPAEKLLVTSENSVVAAPSSGAFVGNYYRLIGINSGSNNGAGDGLRVNNSYFGLKCEAECAFYIRKVSGSNLIMQMSLKSSNGNTLLILVQSTGISVYREVNSEISKTQYARTLSLGTRYVLRCELSGTGSTGYVYLNDELLMTKTRAFVLHSDNYPSHVAAVYSGSTKESIIDVEYYRYRRL